jgi:hypothetical protein
MKKRLLPLGLWFSGLVCVSALIYVAAPGWGGIALVWVYNLPPYGPWWKLCKRVAE